MKKISTTLKYKKILIKRARKSLKRRKKKRKKLFFKKFKKLNQKENIEKIISIIAPKDFRIIENTEECLLFFRKIRSDESVLRSDKINLIRFSLKQVESIDYGAISILTAISDDLKSKNIILQGDFPDNYPCRKFLVESGFLNHMYDQYNKPFPKSKESDLIFFEKGKNVLSEENSRKITTLMKNIVKHLTGQEGNLLYIKSIILEICGNSIEWSGTNEKQWLLGIKYENNKTIFTVTDVEKGILNTLHRKFGKKIADKLFLRSENEILERAFDKKYDSSSGESNRNKGLPSIKTQFEEGKILNLKVLTNNVILHFDNKNNSKTFVKGSPRFKGTFYQWEINKDCIKNK